MNNHQNTIFYQPGNFLKTPLALLGVDLKNTQSNQRYTAILWGDKISHFSNHPYLYKGLLKNIN